MFKKNQVNVEVYYSISEVNSDKATNSSTNAN